MIIDDFKLEHFFDRWEFVAPLMLGSSDPETYALADLLRLADDECLEWWKTLRLGYTEVAGHPKLRSAIASLYDSVTADDVVVFAGAQEAIFALMNILVTRNDHVVALWPGYQSLYELPRALGGQLTLLPLEYDDRWCFPMDRLATILRETRVRLVVLNYPHNPTGAQLDRATFGDIVALTREHGARVFSDEVYRFAEHADEDRLPAAADLDATAVSLGVMSKAFGLAGLRIGWIASRDREVVERLKSFKHYLTICSSGPSEVLATIALRARMTIMERNRGIMQANLAHLDGFFERWRGVFEWVRPRAGTVAFPRLCADVEIDRFAEELARDSGVLVLPGTVFDYQGNHFRIGYGRQHLPEALSRLERYAERSGLMKLRSHDTMISND